VHPRYGAIRVDIALNLGAPVPGPVGRLHWVVDITPGPEADREQDLLSERAEIAEVEDRDIGPGLKLLHRVDPIHPWLGIIDHDASGQELSELGSSQEPLLHEHFHPGRPR